MLVVHTTLSPSSGSLVDRRGELGEDMALPGGIVVDPAGREKYHLGQYHAGSRYFIVWGDRFLGTSGSRANHPFHKKTIRSKLTLGFYFSNSLP